MPVRGLSSVVGTTILGQFEFQSGIQLSMVVPLIDEWVHQSLISVILNPVFAPVDDGVASRHESARRLWACMTHIRNPDA
jgi:hypothetical protein